MDFTVSDVTLAVAGNHGHFFLNTVLPEQAGVPGPWVVYAGDSSFTGLTVANRPRTRVTAA